MPQHENIVKVYAVYQTVHHVYIVTEFCDGRLNNVRSEDYESVALGIINGLNHLRINNIIHRDLKTDNIIMKGNTPKIIDFGFARMLSHS
jgi:serine/threonine protein kinase